jgi:hypothetical protein
MTRLPMSSPPDEPRASDGPQDRPPRTVVIQSSVLTSLGCPAGLYRISVMPLWGDYCRVNVLVGTDPTDVRIAHSYFIEADEGGLIRSSTPPLTRLYL